MALPSAFDEKVVDATGDGFVIGNSATEKVAFYGKAPLVRRPYSSAVHATSALVTSAGSLFVASHLAAIQEIQLTLIGLGVWATA